MSNEIIEPNKEAIKKRYETLLQLFSEQFLCGMGLESYKDSIYISKELLHCAVKAYFDDIYKYKAYAGSLYADKHKQSAYTMIWISRFKPIQIRNNVEIETTLLTINQIFAIYAGLMFLDPKVMDGMKKGFFDHLIYILTYREIDPRSLATITYLMERVVIAGGKF